MERAVLSLLEPWEGSSSNIATWCIQPQSSTSFTSSPLSNLWCLSLPSMLRTRVRSATLGIRVHDCEADCICHCPSRRDQVSNTPSCAQNRQCFSRTRNRRELHNVLGIDCCGQSSGMHMSAQFRLSETLPAHVNLTPRNSLTNAAVPLSSPAIASLE